MLQITRFLYPAYCVCVLGLIYWQISYSFHLPLLIFFVVFFQVKMKAAINTVLHTQYRGGELQQTLTPAECHKTRLFVFIFKDALSAPAIAHR